MGIEITERRLVEQDWYETELSKTGWASHDWIFKDTRAIMDNSWNVVKILDSDKFGNPLLGIAERSIENQTIKINQTVMEELANEIINIFESDCPVPTSLNDWKDDSEKIMLYLAAKKYLERHG
jgi:hypothetical protein